LDRQNRIFFSKTSRVILVDSRCVESSKQLKTLTRSVEFAILHP